MLSRIQSTLQRSYPIRNYSIKRNIQHHNYANKHYFYQDMENKLNKYFNIELYEPEETKIFTQDGYKYILFKEMTEPYTMNDMVKNQTNKIGMNGLLHYKLSRFNTNTGLYQQATAYNHLQGSYIVDGNLYFYSKYYSPNSHPTVENNELRITEQSNGIYGNYSFTNYTDDVLIGWDFHSDIF